MVSPIRVEGLAEFNRALRQLDSDAPKQLRIVQNDSANLLIDKTRPKVPKRTGAARAAMKASSTRTSARIAVGGRKAPYFPWLDFGGKTGRNRSVDRPFFKKGRYVFVTLEEIAPEIEASLLAGITSVAEGAGIEVS